MKTLTNKNNENGNGNEPTWIKGGEIKCEAVSIVFCCWMNFNSFDKGCIL